MKTRCLLWIPPLAWLALGGCTTASKLPTELEFDTGQPGVVLSSSPPGAEVWIDGRYSGFSTPCALALDKGEAHKVELQLPGYAPATRLLTPHGQFTLVPWADADVGATRWRFPTFQTLGGFLVPVKRDNDPWPSRVHVRLRLLSEA